MKEKIQGEQFLAFIGICIALFFGGLAVFLMFKHGEPLVIFKHGEPLPIITLLAIGILGVYLAYYSINRLNELNEEVQEIEIRYKNALKGTDKAEALRLGRIYYASLRDDGKVTTYDEQAIANDLNTIMNTVNVVNTVVPKVEGGDPNLNSLIANQNRLYCSNCGNAYLPSEDKKFCEMCGNRL